MPHQISWLVEGRVITAKVSGTPAAEEAARFDGEISIYLQEAQSPLVHVVFDTTELQQLPGLSTLSRFTWISHPRTGWITGYPKPNMVTGFLTSVVAQLFKARFRTFETREEALAFLNDVDQTLPNLQQMEQAG